MAKKLLGLALAILMACPTTSFAQEDVFAAVRDEIEGARLKLVLEGPREIRATLVRMEPDGVVVRDVKSGTAPVSLHRPEGGERGTYILRSADVRSATVRNHSRAQIDPTTEASQADVVRGKIRSLGVGKQVRVWASSGGWRIGTISTVSADAFHLRTSDAEEVFAYNDVRGLEVLTPAEWKRGLKELGWLCLGVILFGGALIMSLALGEAGG